MFRSPLFSILVILAVGGIHTHFSAVAAKTAKKQKQVLVDKHLSHAIFAGGCFWCMEPPFEKLKGVTSAVSGYIGGHKKNPTYKEVSRGKTGHLEAVRVTFNPKLVSYKDLLEVFWRNVDPTDAGGQFVDRGQSYETGIFYLNETQKKIAKASKAALAKTGRFKKKIITPIRKATTFYKAEDYHQDYYLVNPVRYQYYRYRSGRDEFLDKTWGKEKNYKPSMIMKAKKYMKPSEEELKKKLTKIQYNVTQKAGTEPSYKNEYWDNKQEGIYVDVVSGEPLFSSKDKFDSGTGWPSFTTPLVAENIIEKTDRKLFVSRTEIRSKNGDSHLGHLFSDGPKPTGLRYCINSASLRFVAKQDLKKEGLDQFIALFETGH